MKSLIVCEFHLQFNTLKIRSKYYLFAKMSTNDGKSVSVLTPSESVRGITRLDKSLFTKTICVPFVEVEEEKMGSVIDYLKPYLLKLKEFNPIEATDDKKRIITLHPDLISSVNDFKEKIQSKVDIDLSPIKELKFKDIVITYDNYNYKTIFDAILPSDEDSVTGFSTIGHILHLNLREHTFPYKQLIGQVFLDKVKNSDLIVNKLNTIQNEFRNFEIEVLAKRSDEVNTRVEVTESLCKFEFDFADVYWNPRLSTEHERVYNKLQKGVDVLYDVFAGVGPFAIPAAKRRKCEVLANDLNPECFKWLKHNCKLNKVEDRIKTYNMDGRHFIESVVREDLISRMKNFDGLDLTRSYHIVMNLPALALQFLDAFKGLFALTDSEESLLKLKINPIIHCYCFVKNEPKDGQKVVKQMIEEVLDYELTDIKEIIFVRKVAPNKDMFRTTFTIPEPVLYQRLDCNKRQKIQ